MPDYDKKKVSIADDDGIMRELLKGILRTAGHTVVGEASNGEQAIAMVEKTSPEVLCLDIHMPKMDGMQCLEALKASTPNLTIIMISGEATLPVVQEALSKGAGGFIVKPFNAAKVLDTIQRVCAKQAA
jgi:two-component system chemotaxis response regulator CheY